MRSISQLIDYKLTLVQPKWTKSEYEILFGNEVVARILFKKVFSSRAEIETAEGIWHLAEEGFLKRKLNVSRLGHPSEDPQCTLNGWTGVTTVLFPDGKKFFVKTNVWKSLTEIKKESGETAVSIITEGFFRRTTTITMNRTAAVALLLPVLVVIGIYLEIVNRRNSKSHVVHVST